MKNIFKILAVLGIMGTASFAQADVYECENNSQKLLLALKDDGGGILFKSQNGFYSDMKGSVEHVTALDGGPTTVNFTPEPEEINWDLPANSSRCYAWGEPSLSVVVRLSNKGDKGSEVIIHGEPIMNPKWPKNKMCSIPRPLIHPMQISCRYL